MLFGFVRMPFWPDENDWERNRKVLPYKGKEDSEVMISGRLRSELILQLQVPWEFVWFQELSIRIMWKAGYSHGG